MLETELYARDKKECRPWFIWPQSAETCSVDRESVWMAIFPIHFLTF